MTRKTKVSLLSKFREQYYQNLPDTKGQRELRLLCDIVNDEVLKESKRMGCIVKRNRITNSKELKACLFIYFNITIAEETIEQVRSWKKTLFIPNNKSNNKTYKQKF
jgi:hypothetical protein